MSIRVELVKIGDQVADTIECSGIGWLQRAPKNTQEQNGEENYYLMMKEVKFTYLRQIEACLEDGLIAAVFVTENEAEIALYPVNSNPKAKLIGIKKVDKQSGEIHNRVPRKVKKGPVKWSWGDGKRLESVTIER